MKNDIEKKILIPFIIILMASILIIVIASFVNGYNLLLDNSINNSYDNLKEMIYIIERLNNGTIDENDAKASVINYYEDLGKNNLIIFNDDEIILNTVQNNNIIGDFMNEELDNGPKSITLGSYIFTYQKYEKWNWVFSYCLDTDDLYSEVMDSQNYIILIAIIAVLINLQALIFAKNNISEPIKMLAEHCDKIVADGIYKERIEINRNDEIGILSNTFNNVLDTVQNNTDRLIEATKFNEDILRNISAGIITADQYGCILSINQTAEDFLTPEAEKINLVKEYLHKQIMETLNTKMKINKILAFDDGHGGNKKYIDVTTSLLIGGDGSISGAICNFNDITERKRIENSMSTLDRLTTIGQFASGIAHEVRNPLAGMKTSIQVLKNRLCKEDKEMNVSNKKLLDGVLFEIDRLNYLTTDLLDFAKPRMPSFEKTDLMDALNKSLNLIGEAAKENNIEINIKNNCGKTIAYVDRAQAEQIFINVIKNALNAMDKGGTLHIIFNNCTENEEFIEIIFHDNGCGIPPKDLSKVFNPFFTTGSQGTGLGLSVVYELVIGNQGGIDIQSAVNEGTKVIIRFPINGGSNEN
ncbi:MAG: ATP-binding protein [Tissierellia bacterium]|nr:ATP-binding protein [Tissierellia bacterium]